MDITRCPWCGHDPLYVAYHDTEWGVPQHDDPILFEFLILEGAQAGLSWITILRKRENYRRAFDGFDVGRIARYTETDIARLLNDPGIVRNRLKIRSAIINARAFLNVQQAFGSFDGYLWRFTEADVLSKDMKARGFRFVGPTICHAFMQAVGLINDHLTTCFRYREISRPPLPSR